MTIFDTIEARIQQDETPFIEITDEEIEALTVDDIARLQALYGATSLMRLPERERGFFQWVKEEDPGVWKDLWSDDEEMLVTLAFLRNLKVNANGFPICELEKEQNYFFTRRHIRKEGVEALPGILKKVENGQELSVGEALMFELLTAPIDIWHFCFRYGVPLIRGKQVAEELADHGWLVHLPHREDLVRYIED